MYCAQFVSKDKVPMIVQNLARNRHSNPTPLDGHKYWLNHSLTKTDDKVRMVFQNLVRNQIWTTNPLDGHRQCLNHSLKVKFKKDWRQSTYIISEPR